MLTRDAILAAPDTKPKRVDVPEWGGFLFVRALTAAEAEGMRKDEESAGYGARLAARCICDEAGARVFTDADVAALGAKSAAAMNRVLNAITGHNAIGDEEVAKLGEASTGAPGAGSPSASPATSG